MDAIKISIYLSEKRRQESIYIVDDSTVPIAAEFQDASLDNAEVIAYAKAGDTIKSANCSVDGNTAVFTPSADFFSPGRNRLQYEIGGRIISFAIDVICGKRISKGGA
ncbi:MAG: hypothetical protein Q4P84_04930 [Elusimicrobiales bacterium]|nr:hypothetical protein [Elusimicrobiales bacterium]